ncbi:MAG TPA: type II secretion system F family protein [Phycisphaerae bacterium]
MTIADTPAAKSFVRGAVKSFAYEAQTADGHRFKGTLEAESPDEVQAKLSALQLHVILIEAAEAPRIKQSSLGADEFVVFNQQLAHLTQAGLPVERGLRLIALDIRSGRLARAADDVAAELESGTPLQEAFSRHATRFPPLYGKLVDAGANSGNLPGMLFNLGRHMELVSRLRQSLWRTISYPLMVLAALAIVLLFISLRVLPHFEDMYSSMYRDFRLSGDPPFLTQALLSLGHIYPYVFGILCLILGLILGTNGILRLSGHPGIRWVEAMRFVPLIGRILQVSLLARWIDAMRLGIEAGLDLPKAIGLATDSVGATSGRLARESVQLADVVRRGLPLTSFQGSAIPSTITTAMELGAATTDLPSVLRTLTKMYEQQAEHRLKILPTIISPLMLMIVGTGIALSIGALFLPFTQFLRWMTSGFGP